MHRARFPQVKPARCTDSYGKLGLDEAKWCENLARALGLRKVALKTVDNRFVPLRISLQDISAPLTDPRVVEAAL